MKKSEYFQIRSYISNLIEIHGGKSEVIYNNEPYYMPELVSKLYFSMMFFILF